MSSEGEPSDDTRSPRERVYDAEIAPLMTQIIEICKRESIPFAAQFEIGPGPDPDTPWLITRVVRAMRAGVCVPLMAMTIFTPGAPRDTSR